MVGVSAFAVDPQTVVGRSFAPQRAFVEPRRLKFFLDMIGERDAIYHDVEAARAAGYRDIPIPPTYLFCLRMLDNPGQPEVLDVLGVDVSQILHGEQRFLYHGPVCVGDELVFTTRVGDITEKKGGAMTLIRQDVSVENNRGEHVVDIVSSIVVRNPQGNPGAAR